MLSTDINITETTTGVSNKSAKPGAIVGHNNTWTFVNTVKGLQILWKRGISWMVNLLLEVKKML